MADTAVVQRRLKWLQPGYGMLQQAAARLWHAAASCRVCELQRCYDMLQPATGCSARQSTTGRGMRMRAVAQRWRAAAHCG